MQLRQSTAIPAVSKGLGPTSRKRTRRQARRKDGNGDARLEPESSRKRDITKDNAEQIRSHPMSLVAQSDIMEETGQSQDESKHETEEKDEQKDQPAGIQSAADDECTVSSERDVERLNDSDVSAGLVCGTERKTDQPETLDVNTEIEPEQLNSGVLVVLSDTECDASREVTALQDQVGPDHGDKEDENEQSHDNTSCLKASIPGAGEELDQSDKNYVHECHLSPKTTTVQPLLSVHIPAGIQENSKSAQEKCESIDRRASPSERHDTRVAKSSRRSHSTQSSSLSPLSVHERYLRRMPSCHTTSVENNPEDAGWEKRTEEFLRKLQEGSQRSAAPASYHYSHRDESELSDLSSVTSESSADYMDVDVIDDSDNSLSSPRTTCRDPVDWLMGSATDQVGNRKHDRSRGSKSKSKDRIESEVSKHQTSKDHRASGVKKTTTKMKVC